MRQTLSVDAVKLPKPVLFVLLVAFVSVLALAWMLSLLFARGVVAIEGRLGFDSLAFRGLGGEGDLCLRLARLEGSASEGRKPASKRGVGPATDIRDVFLRSRCGERIPVGVDIAVGEVGSPSSLDLCR